MGGHAPDDALRFAESLIAARQLHRAAHILRESHPLLASESYRGCFLAANAMFQANNVEEAFKIFESASELFASAKMKESEKISKAASETGMSERDVSFTFINSMSITSTTRLLFFSGFVLVWF